MDSKGGKPPHGSGGFGRWTTDDFGLPAYLYTADDPRPWHQVGNDRITAVASAGDAVQIFTWETCAKYLNAKGGRHLGGGWGYLLHGRDLLSTRGTGNAGGASRETLFGTGYLQRRLRKGPLELRHTLYAPPGDRPFIVSQIEFSGGSGAGKFYDWFEFWEPNFRELFFPASDLLRVPTPGWLKDLLSPRVRRVEMEGRVLWARTRGPKRSMERPSPRDPWPPEMFLASLDGETEGFEAEKGRFFGSGGPSRPSALRRGRLSSKPGEREPVMVLHRRLRPGRPLRSAVGYAHPPEKIGPLLRSVPTLEETASHWRETTPRWSLPEPWLEREAAWSYYYLRSAALYDRYLEAHSIPQGCVYLYRDGVNGAHRDFAQHAWPMIFEDPPLAREVLAFLFRLQDSTGFLPWDLTGYGARDRYIMHPSDGDLWLLWYATDYVFATRDFGVLDGRFAFHPKHEGKRGRGWDHLVASWRHLAESVGTGSHGLLRIEFSDWNDEIVAAAGAPWDIARAARDGESTLNTAMACAVLPRFADLARLRGEAALARDVERFGSRLRRVLGKQWRGSWFNRAWLGPGREEGRDVLYLEPQPWALLAGVPTREQARRLIRAIRKRLIEPSPIGAAQQSPARAMATSNPGELAGGGVWWALNMMLVEALASRDPGLAWTELKKNTLAAHAEAYPHLWYGIWSGNDTWNSFHSNHPGEAPVGHVPWLKIPALDYREFPVMNAHSHSALRFMLLKMAGVEARAGGYRITPRFPFPEFTYESRLLGLRYGPGRAEGSLVPVGGGRIEAEIAPPRGVVPGRARVEVDGKEVRAGAGKGVVRFPLLLRAGRRVSWKISASRKF